MRTRLVLTFLAVLGCSTSTGPVGPLQGYVRRFDSLAAADCPAPFVGPPSPLCPFIFSAHIGVAEGVLPSHIQVTTKDGTVGWLGWVLVVQNPGRLPGTIDTTFSVVAYDGLDLKSGVLSGGIPEIMIDTTIWSGQYYTFSGKVTGVVTAVGSPCTVSDTTGGNQSPFPPQVCTKATIQASLHVTVGPQTVTIAPQFMNGFILDTAYVHYARSSGKVQ